LRLAGGYSVQFAGFDFDDVCFDVARVHGSLRPVVCCGLSPPFSCAGQTNIDLFRTCIQLPESVTRTRVGRLAYRDYHRC
jgi:hypothetical protein